MLLKASQFQRRDPTLPKEWQTRGGPSWMNISLHCAVRQHAQSLFHESASNRAAPGLEDRPCPRIAARPSSSFATGMIPVKTTMLPGKSFGEFGGNLSERADSRATDRNSPSHSPSLGHRPPLTATLFPRCQGRDLPCFARRYATSPRLMFRFVV